MPGILGNLIFDRNDSTLAILLSIAGLIGLLGLLQILGVLERVLGFLWRLMERAIGGGFRVWERTLSWAYWPTYLLLVIALLAGGIQASNRGWDWINLFIASILLASGVTACTAFMCVSMERYEVARGHKAIHNPTAGQELAHVVVRHGARLGPIMLIIAAAATLTGFALLNQALYNTVGEAWYAIGDAREEPEFLDFLAFALINLLRVVDVLDLARSSKLLDISIVRQSAWQVTTLLSVFKSFFMLVLLQQIIAAIREQRLLSEMIADLWSPHAPIHERARIALSQFGPAAVGPVLQSLGEAPTLTQEQRSALPRILADIGPLSIDALRKALTSEQPFVRGVAALALGHLRAFEAAPSLADLCVDTNENVRACAVEALGLICASSDSSSPLLSKPLPVARWRVFSVVTALPRLQFYVVRLVGNVRRRAGRQGSALSERIADPVARGVAALRSALADPVAAVRIQALGALGRIGPRAPEAVADLIERLRADSDQEQRLAAEAIGMVRASAATAIPALIEATRAAVPAVRAAAAASLGQYRDEAAIAGPPLIALLDDSEEVVRDAAAAAIGLIGSLDGAAAEALRKNLAHPDNERRAQTAEALGEMGESAQQAAPALVRSLTDDNDLVRGKAAEALGRIGVSAAKFAVPALAKSLEDEDNQVKLLAADALGQMGRQASAAVPDLLKSLRHDNAEVRGRAIEALGQIGDPETRPDLEAACRDVDPSVRACAIRALGAFDWNSPSTIEMLLCLLADADAQVRIAALAAADSAPNDNRVVAGVAALLRDPNDEVATRAMQALPRFGEAALPLGMTILCSWLIEDLSASKPAVAAQTLGRFGPPAHPAGAALAQAARTGDAALRHTALWALAMIRPQEAADAFIAGLRDEAADVRIQASAGLWMLSPISQELLADLLEALRDPLQRVRANAAAVLARFDELPPDAEVPLIACTTSPLIGVRRYAAAALSGLDSDNARDCLRRMVNDTNQKVRETAAESLRILESEEIVAAPETIAVSEEKELSLADTSVIPPLTTI